ncbi:MAG: glycoside hydrolase family 97 protein [Bacteroidia bacterium]
MKRRKSFAVLLAIATWLFGLWLSGCNCKSEAVVPELRSPDGQVSLFFRLNTKGQPEYWVEWEGRLVDTSALGLRLAGIPSLEDSFMVASVEADSLDETWTLPWGERESVHNHYRQQTVHLLQEHGSKRKLDLIFRAYNDGIAFCYRIPKQDGLDAFQLADELTEFDVVGDPTAWWIPGDWDSYEHLFNETSVSKIDATSKRKHPNLVASTIPYNATATPLTMRVDDKRYISIHEAALIDYPEMTLLVNAQNPGFTTELVGRKDSLKADLKAPFNTPWRYIQVGKKPGDLAESSLILNLNEPSRVPDIAEWFHPSVYMGIWWEMHLDKARWDLASGKHGATTANAKKYIDFASAHGIPALLVEGWNTGWEHWIGFPDREGIFDFVTPYADFDLEEVVRYGKEKGVSLIMHHETSAAPQTYEQQLDTAYALMERLGIHMAKTGYVGPIIPDGEHHGGQWMVRHYQKTVEAAAKHKIALDIHEPIKDTGLRRTWPNLVAREGLRGQEFNAWSTDGCNPPNHLTIVPFTCGLAGPLDYTPGIFNLSLKPFKPQNQVKTTLAHQLALYVVVYSPVQMAADLPEHYNGNPAFKFIEQVGTDWSETRVLDAEIGRHVTTARKERGTGNWFVGAISGEKRTTSIPMDFLEAGAQYDAFIYRDGPSADWETNATDIVIEQQVVDSKSVLNAELGRGGGIAVALIRK